MERIRLDAAASAAISRRVFIVKDPSLRTGLKPGDSTQDNVSKEKSKNIRSRSRAKKERERSWRRGGRRENERMGPYSVRGEQNPTTNGKRIATGKSETG